MNICMVGYGMMGVWHSEALRRTDAVMHTIVGRRPEATREFAAKYGYRKWTTSLDEALADPAIDVVILATPSEQHEAQAIRCLEAGKHTLIEIPIAMSLAGAERVVAAGEKSGRKYGLCHPMRFRRERRALIERLRSGEETLRHVEKQVLLWAVDQRWVRHLTDLDRLREGIGLQAFAQVDPLVAYKREAFNMYGELMNDIRGDVVKALLTLQVQARPAADAGTAAAMPTPTAKPAPVQLPTPPIAANIRTNRDAATPQTVRKTGPELGRNDPCWCGSGKKYKSCHMNSDRAKASGQPAQAGR